MARCSQRDGPKSHMGNSSAKQSKEDPIRSALMMLTAQIDHAQRILAITTCAPRAMTTFVLWCEGVELIRYRTVSRQHPRIRTKDVILPKGNIVQYRLEASVDPEAFAHSFKIVTVRCLDMETLLAGPM